MESTEITKPADMEMMEKVLVSGDLSNLTSAERLEYYSQVCHSMGLNPLSRPFDYIVLNGRMTLYAKKDATDQLRKINGVSIDDIDIQETETGFRVKVKGHDRDGRSDVEIGCVAKTDMRGNLQNAEMKAVTKAKRRLTLSLCGLGWLDETEIETIPDAKPVIVDQKTGEIVGSRETAKVKKTFDEEEYLRSYVHPNNVMTISYENAKEYKSEKTGQAYFEMTTKDLYCHWIGLAKKMKDQTLDQNARDEIGMKISAIATIMWKRHKDLVGSEG